MPRLPLVPSVHRLLCFGTTPPASGTAWFVTPDLLLTAAHCIGDPLARRRFSGPIQIKLPGDRLAAASVVREDWDLDAALLRLKRDPAALTDSEQWAQTDPPAGVPAGPLGTPSPSDLASKEWYGWGFPDAHQTGMAVNGEIDTPLGNVQGQPALQLTCKQGGLGHLQGLSGGPVCYGDQIVGMVRFGPPGLAQRVLMATSMKDLAQKFPEIRLSSPASVQDAPAKGPPVPRPLNLFISYAREDRDLVDELGKHLKLLNRQNLINVWFDRPLLADQPYAGIVDERLEQADIVFLLTSPDFLASDYCFEGEVELAMKLNEQNDLRVIPLLGRPVGLENVPFSRLRPLPSNGVPISEWRSRDQAWVDVVRGLRTVIESIQKRPPRGVRHGTP